MTQPGIEPRSPGPLANTLTARPNCQESTTIVNACTKKSGNLLKAPSYSRSLPSQNNSYLFKDPHIYNRSLLFQKNCPYLSNDSFLK